VGVWRGLVRLVGEVINRAAELRWWDLLEVCVLGEVDRRKGIPRAPHGTVKPHWIFMDRDHIAQMHEYIIFHCCLPIKKSFFKYVIIVPLIEMQPYLN